MAFSATDDYTDEDFEKILADIKDSLPNGGSLRPLLITHGAKLVREIERLRKDAVRYQWLRARDLDVIDKGGVFAGMTPQNVILNGDDLDGAIDAAIASAGN